MTSTVTFTGLGSGIDIESVVSAMIEAERFRKIRPFERWRTGWENMLDAFQELNGKLISFRSLARSLDTPDKFDVKNAATTDSSVVTATAQSEALNGTHEIIVNQVAKADIWVHEQGLASESSRVTEEAATFQYQYAGKTVTIEVPKNTTLSQMLNLINKDPANPGVRATILNTGSGETPFHLVLTGDKTGEANNIEITSTLDHLSDFTNTQTAQDAQIRVNGFPQPDGGEEGGPWIARQSNTISDVIPGVTLSIIDTGEVTLTVSQDTDAVKENIVNFVNSFNEIRTFIRQSTSYDTDKDKAGVLIGNYGVDIVRNSLNRIMSSPPSGFVDGWDTYVNIMQIGISTDAELGSETMGQLVIDHAKLDEALASNPQAVADLFSEYFTGRSRSSQTQYHHYVDGITKAGSFQVRYNNATGKAFIKHESSTTWNEATVSTDTGNSLMITGKYGNPEAGLSVRIIDKTDGFWDGTNSAHIDLKRGLAGILNEELARLTNSETGPLPILIDNYNDIISSIDQKIEREETRLEIYERRLKMRYGRLEALLTRLNAQSSSISNVAQQMQNN